MHEVVVFSGPTSAPSSRARSFLPERSECNLGFQFFNSLAGAILHLPDAQLCAAPRLGGEL
jgi:hypothetical protein